MDKHTGSESDGGIPPHLPANPAESYDPEKTTPAYYDDFPEVDNRRIDPSPSPWILETQLDVGEGTPVESAKPDSEHAPPGYRLRRVIGIGGIGEVWEATQPSLGRVIAVKRLRGDIYEGGATFGRTPHMFEHAFRQEALTTGSLEHPNIVPVYDFGLDSDGRPLLAMKLVRGEPWDQMIAVDFESLDVMDFLARHIPTLIDVGNAVAYAHSRGIVHRDIKPSQVMVGEFGEVVLMDWGLAVRFIFDESEPKTRDGEELWPSRMIPTTATASNPSGTPAYMAPEQTEKDATSIGPWTDVYLMGGALYALLTGSPPHRAETSADAFALARMGIIERPEDRAPDRTVPKELADLCMQAMAKDPQDRIASAKEFVAALQDFLTGANRRHESIALMRRVVDRLQEIEDDYHALADALNQLERALFLWDGNTEAATWRQHVLAAYARAAIGSKDLRLARVQAERLDETDERARLLEEIAVLEAEQRRAEERLAEAFRQAQEERDRARSARARAEDLVGFMLLDLHTGLRRIGKLDVLQKIAEKAYEYYESFPIDEQGVESLHKRALSLHHIGEVLREQGNLEQALRTFTEFKGLAKQLIERDPENDRWAQDLAEAYSKMGEVLYEQRDLEGTLRAYSSALEVRIPLAAKYPDDFEIQNKLAWVYGGMGTVRWRLDRIEKALDDLHKSIEIREKLIEREPDNPAWKDHLAWSMNCIGPIYMAAGEKSKAVAAYDRAIQLRKDVLHVDPTFASAQRGLAWSYGCIGYLHQQLADYRKAERAYQGALDILRRQAEQDPTNDRLRRDIAWSLGALGNTLQLQGNLEAACAVLEDSVEMQTRLLQKDPSYVSLQKELGWSNYFLGDVYAKLNDMPSALESFLRSLDMREKTRQQKSGNPLNHRDSIRSLLRIGDVQAETGESKTAEDTWKRARSIFEENGSELEELERVVLQAEIALRQGRFDDARPLIQRLRELDDMKLLEHYATSSPTLRGALEKVETE
ncbi:tetratricopeptide repeat protein [bacterium]|nr:tetratricopeptide repeat protein [bacterium]